jgi:catechol 2,3-dioxygenase-like lactoylglutathione lyase family enzyme
LGQRTHSRIVGDGGLRRSLAKLARKFRDLRPPGSRDPEPVFGKVKYFDMEFNKLIPELMIEDMSKSKHFYVEQLGFELEFERTEDNFAQVAFEGSQLMLEQDHDSAWIAGSLSYPRGRGINFQIEVSDLNLLLERVSLHEIAFFREANEVWYRVGDLEEGVREFLVQDPDGYLLRFQEYLGQRPHVRRDG